MPILLYQMATQIHNIAAKTPESEAKMVWLFVNLIEWMCWRIRSSLQSGPGSFTTMAVPLDCIAGRMML